MNRKQLFAAAALAVLGTTSAFAGGEFDPMTGFGPVGHSTLTREQVKAEFARARDSGELVSFDTGVEYAQAPKAASTLTREQVREETQLALKNRRAVEGS